MSDQSPKSAVELAMERLRQQDAEAGVAPTTLSDQQKSAIGDVRSIYQAKLAYAELMHKFALRNQPDPASRATIEEQYQRDRERVNSERDAKIDQIRRGRRTAIVRRPTLNASGSGDLFVGPSS